MSALRSCAPFKAGALKRAGMRRPTARVCAGVRLYANPNSRSKIVEWYLQEIGASDVEIVNLQMGEKREHKSEAFKKVNPFGKLPALEDGDFKLFESGAILLYLADRYGKLSGPQQRATAAQWTLFANSTLFDAVFVEQWRERSMAPLLGDLDSLLAGRPFLCGQEFSVSDVAVGSYLLYIPAYVPQVDLSPYPNVLAYMKRMAERPACVATVAAPRAPPSQPAAEAKAETKAEAKA